MTGVLACDCLIVGGGPAGTALASVLRRWERSVVLVDDGRKKHAIPAETLVPTAARRIEECGFASVFAEHGFFGVPRQGVIWNSDEASWRSGDEHERGFKAPLVVPAVVQCLHNSVAKFHGFCSYFSVTSPKISFQAMPRS